MSKFNQKTKKGNVIPQVIVLVEHQTKNGTYPQLITVTDFDNKVNGTKIGDELQCNIRVSSTVSNGRAYLNYTVA